MHQQPQHELYLRPGEIFFGKGRDIIVRTLLGSCVAITLWHPKQHFGGMCHITMPTRGQNSAGQGLDTCYADEVMTFFMNKLTSLKLAPREFYVGVYGGGKMFASGERGGDVGMKNVNAALMQLESQRFCVHEQKTGSNVYRKVWLSLNDGHVKLVETHTRG